MNQQSAYFRGAVALALLCLCLDSLPVSQAAGGDARASVVAKNPNLTALPLPPVIISDQTFQPEAWDVSSVVVGSASYTVTQQLSGGFGGAFRFMSHRLPPVPGSGGNTIFVTHVYTSVSYYPTLQGAISSIDYAEAGIILSFPFPETFSTTQPVIVQGGQVYRSPRFIRFVASNSSHAWETRTLTGLTAADFIRVGGSENDHPDFSASAGPIQFGFTRNNSRTATLPPIPPNQDMVVDQGVDNWQVLINRQPGPNRPPIAVDDVFILDGYTRQLPLTEILDVKENDSDPDQNVLEVITVTQPTYGTAINYFGSLVEYQLDEARASDSFSYTIRDILFDGDIGLTDTAIVDVYIDCACTVLCLNQFVLPPLAASPLSPVTDTIDLPLIYRVRDQVLKPTPHGQRYIAMYYTRNPEILVNIVMSETLRTEAVATVTRWQDNLRSLTDGDGSAVITQAQVDALSSFLSHLSAASSTELQQLIAAELQRLGPLNDYVGLTMSEAKRRAIGDATVYLPLLVKRN